MLVNRRAKTTARPREWFFSMEIGGTYPMLYAFFDDAGRLRRDALSRQIEASIAAGASGIGVLGLGTEVQKLGRAERRSLVEWTIADVAGRVPVVVTIADGNVIDMVESARFALDAGASWLILQPPRPPASGAHLIEFFGAVADSVECPIGIQNAPEFLGMGLSPADLLTLNTAAPQRQRGEGREHRAHGGGRHRRARWPNEGLQRPRRLRADGQSACRRRRHDPRHRDHRSADRHRARHARRRRNHGRRRSIASSCPPSPSPCRGSTPSCSTAS